MYLESYLAFSIIVVTYLTVTLFTKCFHVFFLCRQLLVKILYGLLHSKVVIILTLSALRIFIPLLIQMTHIG